MDYLLPVILIVGGVGALLKWESLGNDEQLKKMVDKRIEEITEIPTQTYNKIVGCISLISGLAWLLFLLLK